MSQETHRTAGRPRDLRAAALPGPARDYAAELMRLNAVFGADRARLAGPGILEVDLADRGPEPGLRLQLRHSDSAGGPGDGALPGSWTVALYRGDSDTVLEYLPGCAGFAVALELGEAFVARHTTLAGTAAAIVEVAHDDGRRTTIAAAEFAATAAAWFPHPDPATAALLTGISHDLDQHRYSAATAAAAATVGLDIFPGIPEILPLEDGYFHDDPARWTEPLPG